MRQCGWRKYRLIRKALLVGLCLCMMIIIETGVCFAAASCNFSKRTSTIDFGNLDPFSSTDQTATVTITISCQGSPQWFLDSNNGIYFNGTTARMRHETKLNEYLPYTLTFYPTRGTKHETTITGSGIILNSSHINAYAGTYSDSVTLTINP
jgi:spore coat protein U-like protein